MAFQSFGAPSKSPAPAPGGGGFSFGSKPAPAPAPGGNTFSFGGTPAPAPAFGAPSPAPAFGTPGAAPASGSLFGGTPAPATTAGGLFGSAPAPSAGAPAPAVGAPPTGGLFGSAPSPATGSLFGSTAPASGLFGNTPGAPAATTTVALSGQTPYSSLPPDAKRALDTIYEHIMRHRRAMIQVKTMAPQLLRDDSKRKSPSSPADVAAGIGNSSWTTLPVQLTGLQRKINELKHTLDLCCSEAVALRKLYETSTTQAVMYGKWPIEAIAVREGVKLSSLDNKADPKVQNDLKALFDDHLSASVDRVEQVPSPYLWEVIQDLEARLIQLQQSVTSLQSQLQQSHAIVTEGGTFAENITSVVQLQTQALMRVAGSVARIHEQMEQLRVQYRQHETGGNVLEEADAHDLERQRRIDQQMRVQYVKAAPTQAPQPAGPSAAPAPTSLFGSTTPAPATGGLFGSTSAAAPSTGGLFGSTPAAAPTTGAFGSTPAPAPGGGLFGSSPAPATGGAFGTTAAPAPGGLFGSTAATPAPGPFSFGGSTSNISTPKSKSKSRSSRRR